MATDEDFFQRFYSVLTSKIGKGVYSAPGFGAGAIVFCSPGIIIDPTADWNVPAVRDRFSAIVDFVLDPSYVSGNAYGTNYTRLSDLYQGILTFRNYATTALSPAEEKALIGAKSKLFVPPDFDEPSPKYSKYLKLYNDAIQAQIAYVGLASTPNPDVKEIAERRAAFNATSQMVQNYDAVNGITQAENDVRRLAWRDGSGYWNQLDKRANAYRVPDTSAIGLNGTLFLTDFYPTIPSLLDPKTKWTRISVNEKEVVNANKMKATSWGVHGGGGAFGWGGRASYGESTTRIAEDNEVTDFKVELEFTTVFIMRPWMDIGVFYSRAWDWDDSTTPWLEASYHNGQISNGPNIAKGDTPNGISPWVPVGLIVAKNTKFTGHWQKDVRDFYERHIRGSAGASYWGFSVGGNYSMDETSDFRKGNLTDSSLEFPDPQIIAMVCIPLPLSPNWDEQKYGPKPTSEKAWPGPGLNKIFL